MCLQYSPPGTKVFQTSKLLKPKVGYLASLYRPPLSSTPLTQDDLRNLHGVLRSPQLRESGLRLLGVGRKRPAQALHPPNRLLRAYVNRKKHATTHHEDTHVHTVCLFRMMSPLSEGVESNHISFPLTMAFFVGMVWTSCVACARESRGLPAERPNTGGDLNVPISLAFPGVCPQCLYTAHAYKCTRTLLRHRKCYVSVTLKSPILRQRCYFEDVLQ